MMGRYSLFYAGVYIAFVVVTAVILTMLDLEGGASLGATTSILTALLIGQVFAKEQQRKALRGELHQLLLAFTAVAATVTFLQALIFFWFLEAADRQFLLEQFNAGIMLAVAVIGLLLHYGLSWLGFSLGCRGVLKKQAKLRGAD